ncbi:hypothetical protein RhiJN_21574 [Ceratobasidium sp. AG-Ba]|nr:hypothetical protein RhiJN_21574 [Ceratobasidium sp. AG-Ba]
MLPELTELAGPASRIIELLIGRPIKKVDVALDVSLSDITTLAALKFALGESSGPVTELILRQGSMQTYGLWTVIKFDPSSPLLTTLRRLTLHVDKQADQNMWTYHARDLRGYQVLEELVIESSPDPERQYQVDILSELRRLTFWQSCCSSLRTVKIFGTILI